VSDPSNHAKSIFLAAIEAHAPEQWPGFLDQACAGDVRLRAEVEKLLRARSEMGSFHEPPRPAPFATVDAPIIGERPGTAIGPYKLIEQIGEGGMGTVYMAQQTVPVKRAVALKIIKAGMDTRQVIARFEAERQALALMDHPSIAKVLDAGTTGGESPGRPYFVMELVKGVSITRYCDEHRLTPRQRLELFIPVCQAVQHAHQKGIIHRDLKPSNILVAQYDGRPVPKVIDFGVAKAAGQPLTDKTLMTGFGSLIGTLEYMSPEQAEINQLDIDTRSDIYSLGVVLYELLTGSTPLDRKRLTQAAFTEMLRIIREEEPQKPSTRLSDSTDSLPSISAQRHMEPAKLTRSVRGELDWIVMKALEKDRSRRYETANGFAADLQRYLDDEPVQASPPSAWYRFRKFARRKKTALAMAACVLLALAGIAGGLGWAVRDRTAREEEIGRKEAQQRDEIDREVTRALDEAGALGNQAKWPEALSAIERARKLLEAAGRQEFPQRLGDLEADVTMVLRLEEIYRKPKRDLKSDLVAVMGSDGTYREPKRTAISSEKEFFWGRQQDAAFARAYREFGIDADSVEPAEAAARMTGRSIGRELAKGLDQWAAMRRRARESNDPSWKKLVEIARQADPDVWRDRCREGLLRGDRHALEQIAESLPIRQVPPATLWLLGDYLMELGARDKAVALLRQAQHAYPDDQWINEYLAWFCLSKFQPPLLDDALRFYSVSSALGPRHPAIHFSIADVWMAKGAVDEAIAECSQVIELNPENVEAWHRRGYAHLEAHQYEKAIADWSKVIELDPKIAAAWNNRGCAYGRMAKWDNSIADVSKAIELDPKSAVAWHNRGLEYSNLNQWDKALADFSKAIELDPEDAIAWTGRGRAYHELNQLDKALADVSKAIELDPKHAAAWNGRGLVHRELKQWDNAFADLSKAIELDPEDAAGWYNRGRVYWELNQRENAIADYSKAIELDPKLANVWNNRGRGYNELKQWENAIADLSKAIELDLKLAAAWSARGRAYINLKQFDKALADLSKAIELDPKLGEAWNNRGVAHSRLKQFDQAVADYSKAIELEPKKPAGWYNRGRDYHVLKQLDKAIADVSRAIELDPKNAAGWYNRGRGYHELKQWENAIADLSKAIELNPKFAAAWSSRGLSYEWLKQFEKAIADYSKATQTEGNSANAGEYHNRLAWLLATCSDPKFRDPRRAVDSATKAVEFAPKNGDYWRTLAWAQYRAGNWKGAVTVMEKVKELGSAGDSFQWFLLAMANRQLGNNDQARQWCDRAIQWMDKNEAANQELRRFRAEAAQVLGVVKKND